MIVICVLGTIFWFAVKQGYDLGYKHGNQDTCKLNDILKSEAKQQLDYYKKRSELIDKYIKSGEIGDFEELKKL